MKKKILSILFLIVTLFIFTNVYADVYVTSESYVVDNDSIYIGFNQFDPGQVHVNSNIWDTGIKPKENDPNSFVQTLDVYSDDEETVLKEYDIISLSFNDDYYLFENNHIIYLKDNFDINDINVRCKDMVFKGNFDSSQVNGEFISLEVVNNKLEISKGEYINGEGGEILLDRIPIVHGDDSYFVVTSDLYDVYDDYIYTRFNQFDVNHVTVSNPSYTKAGDTTPNEETFYILNGNETVKEYDVITLSFNDNSYSFENNQIIYTKDNFDINDINVRCKDTVYKGGVYGNQTNDYLLLRNRSDELLITKNKTIDGVIKTVVLDRIPIVHGVGDTYEGTYTLTSDLYDVSDDYIYTGFNQFDVNHVTVSNTTYTKAVDTAPNEETFYILNGNETVKEYDVITLSFNDNSYSFEDNQIIYTKDNFDLADINVTSKDTIYKGNLPSNITQINGNYVLLKVINDKLHVVKGGFMNGEGGDFSMDQIPIVHGIGDTGEEEITVTSDLYIFDLDSIYTGFNQFDVNHVTVSNTAYTKAVDIAPNEETFYVLNGNETVKEYDVISLSFNDNSYSFEDNQIIYTKDNFDINDINVRCKDTVFKGNFNSSLVNGEFISLEVVNNKLEISKGEYINGEGGEILLDRIPIVHGVGDTEEGIYTITFHPQNGERTFTQKVEDGGFVVEPEQEPSIPSNSLPGTVFIGWFKDEFGSVLYNFFDKVNSNLNLYAIYAIPNDYITYYLSTDKLDFGTYVIDSNDEIQKNIERKVIITNSNDEISNLLIVNPKNAPFGMFGDVGITLDGYESKELEFTLDYNSELLQTPGLYTGIIKIKSVDDPYAWKEIEATLKVVKSQEQSPIKVNVDAIDFGTIENRVNDSNNMVKTIIITNNSADTSYYVETNVSNSKTSNISGGFLFSTLNGFSDYIGPGESRTALINLDSSYPNHSYPGVYNSVITISYSENPFTIDKDNIYIPIIGVIAPDYSTSMESGIITSHEPTPEIVVSSNLIDFGSLELGSNEILQEKITIINNSPDSSYYFELSNNTDNNSNIFKIIGDSQFDLMPGESKTITFTVELNSIDDFQIGDFEDEFVFKYKLSSLYNNTSYLFDEFYVKAKVTLKQSIVSNPIINKVTFHPQNGGDNFIQEVENGGYATLPTPAPTNGELEFKGWYRHVPETQLFNFNNETITADFDLYAEWGEVQKQDLEQEDQEQSKELVILNGNDQNVFINNNIQGLEIRASGNINEFLGLKMDKSDEMIDPSLYEKKVGSTIIILKPELLSTLTEGNHTLTFVFVSGTVDASFTVINSISNNTSTNNTINPSIDNTINPTTDNPINSTIDNTKNPNTYDNIYNWLNILGISLLGFIGCIFIKKKENN